ncbi:MAG: TRAP transporter small permease subunit [Clostridiales bacterium]|jgi:TRAP-type C4-dicarboxylate transport system permease small subunit|nr:TRAP transporter small permease subunit [Clostridiales bacterium]
MNVLKAFNKILGYISGALICISALVMLYDVFTRYILKSPSLYASYIAAFLMLGAVFLGTAYALQAGGHVNVEIFIDKAKPLPRKILITIGYLLSMVFVFFLSRASLTFAIRAFENQWRAQGNFPIPSVILYGVMFLGTLLLFITLVFSIVHLWKNKQKEGEA